MQQDHQAGADGLAPRQALIERIADLTCDLQRAQQAAAVKRAQRIAELHEGLQRAKQPTANPDELLDAMQELSDALYLRAIRIGVHPFIEFAGLLAERDEPSRRLDHIIHDHHAVRAEAQSRVDRAVMRALAAENDRDEARADRLRAEDISSTLATDFACALAPTLSAIMSTAPEAQPGRGDVKPASPCRCGPDGCSDSVSCPRNGGAA